MAPPVLNPRTAVARISIKFGGMAAFARIIGVRPVTVRTWQCRYGGVIPSKYHAKILAAARKYKKRVMPAELVNV